MLSFWSCFSCIFMSDIRYLIVWGFEFIIGLLRQMKIIPLFCILWKSWIVLYLFSNNLLSILTVSIPNVSHAALGKTLQIFVVIPVYIVYPINLIMNQLVGIPVVCTVVFCMMFNAKNDLNQGHRLMKNI